MTGEVQTSLFEYFSEEPQADVPTPAVLWQRDFAKRALDELFSLTCQYRATTSFHDLMKFVSRFRFYSPFNAMLVHVQMPGATYVAPPNRWYRDYGREIKAGAKPLVILQPMGPVMFVFDVSDTEPTADALPLPPEVEKPFEVRKGSIGAEFEMAIENAKRDGIRITQTSEGSQSAGSIGHVPVDVHVFQQFQTGLDTCRKPVFSSIEVMYDLVINGKLSREARYATFVHELAHLYCGHLGSPNEKWWPDRRGLSVDVMEFEAESIAYLVCLRAGMDSPSEQYLSEFVSKQEQVPAISLECVMKAAGLIESMGEYRMKLRKQA